MACYWNDNRSFWIFMGANLLVKVPDRKSSVPGTGLWRRYCYILLLAGWMGGFTFYALIVIPTAEKVLGGIRDAGFITQQVTHWLNVIGAGAVLILPCLLAPDWRGLRAGLRFGLSATWIAMAVAQLGLFLTHPLIDQFLEAQGHKLHHFEQFSKMHTVYLTFATVQWSAALLQIWLMLINWRRHDLDPSIPSRS
jgi:hypothetical protein